MYFELFRVVAVIGLVVVAAALATPPGKLPLALRGIRRMLRRDLGESEMPAEAKAPVWRRALAFLLVLLAAAMALAASHIEFPPLGVQSGSDDVCVYGTCVYAQDSV